MKWAEKQAEPKYRSFFHLKFETKGNGKFEYSVRVSIFSNLIHFCIKRSQNQPLFLNFGYNQTKIMFFITVLFKSCQLIKVIYSS